MLIPGNKFNPHRLLKKHFIYIHTHTCKHRHTYAEHPRCYFEEKPYLKDGNAPGVERVGFFDIEATNLHATFGYIFSYCIKELDGKIWVHISASRRNKVPSWDDLMMIKCQFLGENKKAIQVLAPRSEHVNICSNCLHIWHCVDNDPLPDFTRGSGML